MAQTCKSLNGSTWSLITTIDGNVEKSINLAKFNNLECLSFPYFATAIPQDLSKLTTLQKLKFNINKSTTKQDLSMIQMLKNLREVVVDYKDRNTEKFDDLLTNHTRLTKLEISAFDIQYLSMYCLFIRLLDRITIDV